MKQPFYLLFVLISFLLSMPSVVRAKGPAGTISGSAAVCMGSTTTLHSSASGGTWQSSTPAVATIGSTGIVTGITAGTSTISYIVGSSRTTQVVTVYTMPAAGTISGASAVLAGATVTFTSSVLGGSWSSSASGIAKVSSSGVVTGAATGTATISYKVSNVCGTATATTTISVLPAGTPIGAKIPMNGKRWYLLNNCSNGLDGLHDSILTAAVTTGYGKILSAYDAYYPILPGERMDITSLRFYSPTGTVYSKQQLKLYYIDSLWNRKLIGTYQAGAINKWVGPNPSAPNNVSLSAPANNVRYLLISCNDIFPNELELYGNYIPPIATLPVPSKTIQMKQELGINAFEWDFLDNANPLIIDEARMKAVNSFRGVRHYLDWERMEASSGRYTFNPTRNGGWNLDAVYARAKADGIDMLVDIKTIPPWIQSTYTSGNRDNENTPINSSGLDFTLPGSYSKQAKLAFQFAARYGYNTGVNPSLVSVDTSLRYTGDTANVKKIGLGLVRYMECDNERDKWWKGRKAYQTGREYAANLSAFYDGHKGSLGAGIGVKNADPSMQVVMCGTALPYTDYLRGMVDWCKEFRGYNADGSVNLCWDVINYHVFPDDNRSAAVAGTRGKAPDVTRIDTFATNLIAVAHQFAHDMPVWLTETGYDVNQASPKKAIPIGSKSVEQVRADWILRHALQNARLGVERTFFYIMYSDDSTNATQFASSGLINTDRTRKPPADYLYQANRLMGEYVFKETISTVPYVDRYELAGQSVFVMVKASEDGSTIPYTLTLNPGDSVTIYTPAIGQDSMNISGMIASDTGTVTLTVSETPIFVIPVPHAAGAAARQSPSFTVNVPHKTIHTNVVLNESDVHLFPNPSTTSINLTIDNDVESDVSIAICTEDGRVMKRTNFSKPAGTCSQTIDITNLPPGFYIMQIGQKNERVSSSFIKVNQ